MECLETLKSINVKALSVAYAGSLIALVRKGNELSLEAFSDDLLDSSELATFRGERGHILFADGEKILLSIDSNLILFQNKICKTTLKVNRSGSVFWHAAEFHGEFLVQEYNEGLGSSSIYSSKDLLNWRKVVCSLDIDKHSLHFHDIKYDCYRDQLIATLGDRNYVRAVSTRDLQNWQILYGGPWQFLSIVPLEEAIVFGMDSGIARGGVGIYQPSKNSWKFIFLRWRDRNVRLAQISDLDRINSRLWVATLGTPQAIVVSKDLANWCLVHLDGLEKAFARYLQVYKENDQVVFCTGKNLLVFETAELEKITCDQPMLVSCKAHLEQFEGALSVLKRKFRKSVLGVPMY